jgi:hypothetical protein
MNRLRGALLALALLTAAAAFANPAAGQREHSAGLVIDYGDGRLTYAVVSFSEPAISGIELLDRSGLSLVTLGFGGLGEAVCSIEAHGCGVGDCRRLCQTSRADSPFWRYFRLVDGAWAPLPLGASSAEVTHGAIDGWSWTGGEPSLPAIDFVTLATRAGEPAENAEAVSRTYDAEGRLFEATAERTSWAAYAGSAAILLVLAGIAVGVAIRRRGAEPERP